MRDPDAAVDVHVADSLTALPQLDSATAVADIGSGAGFPGLVIAIARPDLAVDLIESVSRKCDFMRSAAADLGLQNARVVHSRAEDWAGQEGRERYDAVLARAVAPLASLVEYAAPLLTAGGRLIAWKGEPEEDEEAGGRPRRRPAGAVPRRGGAGSSLSRQPPAHPPPLREGEPDAARVPAPRRGGPEEAAGLNSVRARTFPDLGRRSRFGAERISLVHERGPGGAAPGTTAPACIFGPVAMATVYAVANQKGGVGKTTTAVNLAACVAEAGCRTLLVDLDPQCNATVALGLPKDHEPNTYTCLLDGGAIADAAMPSAIDPLQVVTSTPDLAGATVELPRMDSSEQSLRRAAAAGPRQLRAHRPRLPALARSAVGQRAGRRRPGARPGAGRVPGARGAGAVPRHARV